ncbi:hypothetical protein FUA23_10915 [Neolewinella aurantiaca]|uniref:Outer membrane protein beta-barrel domain-containing protein n=1 Tax=Neolewinella aurantiaca TaxID=2602767 RepID=A0A5C7FDX6_9BACT|nr:hypothetical protein [Neolewinella aurantiaca]TXF89254.1 hypothetical protein FUA23_10915 [Neolewinella aurantiaca]
MTTTQPLNIVLVLILAISFPPILFAQFELSARVGQEWLIIDEPSPRSDAYVILQAPFADRSTAISISGEQTIMDKVSLGLDLQYAAFAFDIEEQGIIAYRESGFKVFRPWLYISYIYNDALTFSLGPSVTLLSNEYKEADNFQLEVGNFNTSILNGTSQVTYHYRNFGLSVRGSVGIAYLNPGFSGNYNAFSSIGAYLSYRLVFD